MKAGIVADNYKLERFKKELVASGFTDFEIIQCPKDTSIIQVKTTADKLKEISKICQKVELHFKRSN